MSIPRELQGVTASAGYAEGPLFLLDHASGEYGAKGTPEAEARALADAIADTAKRLDQLVRTLGGDAGDMLEFQLAMIGDDALTAPAFAAIADGVDAPTAWKRAIEAEIAGYEDSLDEYFRARAADLRDIRDQVTRSLCEAPSTEVPKGAILYGRDVGPTLFLEADWSEGGGIALTEGSAASHVAMLARSRGIPMVVGLAGPDRPLPGLTLLDAEHGGIVISPTKDQHADFERRKEAFYAQRMEARRFLHSVPTTRCGVRILVMVNIADPEETERIDINTCDGVGLMRTEFLFSRNTGLPDEETQYAAYRRVIEWAAGKPVTIRTVDAGGDKPIAGLTVNESNPFLGLRGIRLSLAREDVFRAQVRALLRAGAHGELKVMFPMIAVKQEFEQAAAIFAAEAALLAKASVPHRIPPLGIMVEVPSVAIAPEQLSAAAFFSIGSNDLTQYVMAAARDNCSVAALNAISNPAVTALLARVAAYGQSAGKSVSLCGDAASDPALLPTLLGTGLREISVAPAQLAVVKAAIAETTVGEMP